MLSAYLQQMSAQPALPVAPGREGPVQSPPTKEAGPGPAGSSAYPVIRWLAHCLDPLEILRSVISTTTSSYPIRHEHCRRPRIQSSRRTPVKIPQLPDLLLGRSCTNGCLLDVTLRTLTGGYIQNHTPLGFGNLTRALCSMSMLRRLKIDLSYITTSGDTLCGCGALFDDALQSE